MRKFLLYSSALALLSGVAEAACIQTPSCSSLGYSSSSSCSGGTKCPWGNYWNCDAINKINSLNTQITNLTNKITTIEEKIVKIENSTSSSNCFIGNILYSDMTCSSNPISGKTPIGVVFDTTYGLAIAKDEFANMPWSYIGEDVSGVTNSSSVSTSTADWQGFNNTKAMYEADKSGVNYPAIKKVLTYSTEGTEQGQWYLPAAGELQAISTNKDTLNTMLSKIGGTQMSGNYWSSSEQNNVMGYYIGIGNNSSSTGQKIVKNKAKPVINFGSKNKTNFAYVSSNETACGLGSILYSDKKCYAGSTPSGKTPIGIVVDVSRRTAIALESSSSSMAWGGYGYDTPGIMNIMDKNRAKQDFNGKANTAAIKEYNSSLSGYSAGYPAAKYAYNYTTTGTNAGEWYLPALGELNTAYTYRDFLNYALSLLGKGNIPTNYYWSSSENSAGSAWMFHFGNGDVSGTLKGYKYYVRPVLAF